LGLFLLEILLYDREREKRENMEIQIMDYTKDKIPDMLDFERRLREEAQRFYKSIPDSEMHDVGI